MIEDRLSCGYLLASKPNATLYIGVTSNVIGRMCKHGEGVLEGFTKRYGVHRLVWYEKTMKHWPRQWKINVIENDNLHWDDPYPKFLETARRLF